MLDHQDLDVKRMRYCFSSLPHNAWNYRGFHHVQIMERSQIRREQSYQMRVLLWRKASRQIKTLVEVNYGD